MLCFQGRCDDRKQRWDGYEEKRGAHTCPRQLVPPPLTPGVSCFLETSRNEKSAVLCTFLRCRRMLSSVCYHLLPGPPHPSPYQVVRAGVTTVVRRTMKVREARARGLPSEGARPRPHAAALAPLVRPSRNAEPGTDVTRDGRGKEKTASFFLEQTAAWGRAMT